MLIVVATTILFVPICIYLHQQTELPFYTLVDYTKQSFKLQLGLWIRSKTIMNNESFAKELLYIHYQLDDKICWHLKY